MIIERDFPVPMDDGLVLRADVYRPDTNEPVPVIMTHGPYGKGVMYQEHYKTMWDWLVGQHPDLLPGSNRSYLTWETVDPETWVRWDYAVVRVDSRGAGRSPGYLDIFSPRETLDYYHAIEWAGMRPWSNARVGLNGISYYAINQWHVAALQPPHLTAMVPWEGAADSYRDWYRHGGILSNKFMEAWFPRQVLAIQHGNATAPKDHWMKESSSGPATLSREELDANYCDTLANARAREMDDGWYRSRSPDWSKVITPFLSAGSWAGFGLHPRGNFEAFTQAAGKEKWLEGHPGRHEEWFYLKYGMSCKSASSTIISRAFRTVGKKNHGYGSTCVGLLATSSNCERRMNGRWPAQNGQSYFFTPKTVRSIGGLLRREHRQLSPQRAKA